MIRFRYILIVIGVLLVGMLIGHFGTIIMERTATRDRENAVLYGPSDQAFAEGQRLTEQGEDAFRILISVYADYRGRPPISHENKLAVTEVIQCSSFLTDVLPSLSLGAHQDENKDVRSACLATIRRFYVESFLKSMAMLANTLPREPDVALQHERRLFLETVLFGDSLGEHERQSSPSEFKKICLDRIDIYKERLNGNEDKASPYPRTE